MGTTNKEIDSENEDREIIIRRTILRKELKPVQIYMGNPPRPIDPDWVAITHAKNKYGESFIIVFYKFDGTLITFEQFDTLEIAMDQANAIAGIKSNEWLTCDNEITDPKGRFSWKDF
jgi:hypothetical protein